MSHSDTDWIVIGRFGRPHGLNGYISVVSFTEPPENILSYTDWHICWDKKNWQPIEHIDAKAHTRGLLVQVEGFLDREDLASLTNIDIVVRRDQLPALEQGEYYWHELIGMTVVTDTGNNIGKVTDILPTGSNDVLVVQGDKRRLIPYLQDDVVKNIDAQEKCITVHWDIDF